MDVEVYADAPPPASYGAEVPMDPEQEYADLYAALWPRLYRTALGIAGDRGAAEDAVQGAFAKAYASWGRVRRADHPEAYLRRMVVNELIGTRRRAWWRRERPHGHVDPGTSGPSHEHGVTERDEVWSAIQALPARQRAVIVLRYYEDLSEQQIADVLGCARGTVKSQAAAALANLRRAGIPAGGDQA